MEYTFMNREAELFDVDIDTAGVFGVKDVRNLRRENARLLPVGMRKNGRLDLSPCAFKEWWVERRIPLNREGIEGLEEIDTLAAKSLGLSLSDQYWIRPGKDVSWRSVNFFHNSFGNSEGDLLAAGQEPGCHPALSPDYTTSGAQKKKWKTRRGSRRLLKHGSPKNSFSQPYREEFASRLLSLVLPSAFVVPYRSVKRIDDKTGEISCFSVCCNFIDSSSELVPMRSMLEAKGLKPRYSEVKALYGNYGYVLDLMLIVDYITLNIDRHLGNFGFVRSACTGKALRPAPIYDNGSSLLFDCMSIEDAFVFAKPFHIDFDTQISLVNVREYKEGLLKIKRSLGDVFWRVFMLAPEAKRKGRLEFLLALSRSQLEKLLRMR
jgi:hypothetical protein